MRQFGARMRASTTIARILETGRIDRALKIAETAFGLAVARDARQIIHDRQFLSGERLNSVICDIGAPTTRFNCHTPQIT